MTIISPTPLGTDFKSAPIKEGESNFYRNKKGFTLIETVMVIVLLAIVVPGIMFYFTQGVKDSAYSQRRNISIFLAEAMMEEIRSKRWDETASINLTCSNASAVLGADVGETRINFDDIDDFNNMNNPNPIDSQGALMNSYYQGFSQTVQIWYVNAGSLDTQVAGPTCYKRILVTITDTATNESTQLVSLRTSY